MLVTIVAAAGLVFVQVTRRAPAIPVTMSLVVMLLGIVTVVALIYRVLISPPPHQEAGAYLGLLFAIGIMSAAISRCARRASRAGTRRPRSRSSGPSRRQRILEWPGQMLDRDQVLHVARLARLELSDDEVERMSVELSNVLDHIEKIGELDLDGVPPTSHVSTWSTPCGPTSPSPASRREVALASAPEPLHGGFGVPSPGAA